MNPFPMENCPFTKVFTTKRTSMMKVMPNLIIDLIGLILLIVSFYKIITAMVIRPLDEPK